MNERTAKFFHYFLFVIEGVFIWMGFLKVLNDVVLFGRLVFLQVRKVVGIGLREFFHNGVKSGG